MAFDFIEETNPHHMIRLVRNVMIVAMLLVVAASCSNDSGSRPNSRAGFYSTKTPYAPKQDASSLEAAPEGYSPVFTEMVARHGARALTSPNDIEYVNQLIDYAEADHSVTALGSELRSQVLSMRAANAGLGYGNLSSLGVVEHQELAARMLERLPDLFHEAALTGRRVMVLNSGRDRAVDSGNNFAASLASHAPELAPLIDPPITNTQLLYFFKLNKDYLNWLVNDPTLNAKLNEILYSERSHREARAMLLRLFRADLIDKLAAGQLTFINIVTAKPVVLNDVDLAGSLYDLYQIAPGLSAEGTWQFGKFVPRRAARWFAYLYDVFEFYKKGPSFAGSSITFQMADVLLVDFFDAAGANCSASAGLVADLRFAHAETIIPFATLLQLSNSDQQVPASKTFKYRDNRWRGSAISPYAANVQWDLFSNAAGSCLVRMLYNERQTRFKSGCEAMHPRSYYYRLDQLERCYGFSTN